MNKFRILCRRFLFQSDQARLREGDTQVEEEEEEINSETNSGLSRVQYVLSITAYTVSLGNIWRFPYLAYKNGGGAFFVAYLLMAVLAGAPLYFLESALGQFCSKGPVNVWCVLPLFQGVGISMVVVNTIVSIYYSVLLGYALSYLFASFQSSLPWSGCFSWASSNCSENPTVYCNMSGVLVLTWTEQNCPSSDRVTVQAQSPSEQYWDRVVLRRSSGLGDTGELQWQLALFLLLSFALIAVSLLRDTTATRNSMFFSGVYSCVMILTVMIRGATLEGAADGIRFFIGSQSDWSKLAEGQVWKDAVTQVFFCQSVTFGAVISLSSYNKFNTDIFAETVTLSIISFVASLLSSFAVFSVLGHMSHVYGRPVNEVVQEGFGLAYIVYSTVLAKMPGPPVWSVLFFFWVFKVGINSQFIMIELITAVVLDAFPKITKTIRTTATLMTCAAVNLLGLVCVTRAGVYWVTLLDQFSVSWVLLVLALMELSGICFIYGGNTFIKDIEMMIGKRSSVFWMFWKMCWFYVTPCILLVILVWSLVTFTPPSYAQVQFPAWGLSLGWSMAAFVLLWIPATALYKFTKAEGNFSERLKSLCHPTKEWRPLLDTDLGERYSENQSHSRETALTEQ